MASPSQSTAAAAATASIPIVDFGKFLHGTAEEKKEVARQIDEAFCTVGFVYLSNHGVAEELVEECFTWSKKFFALPLQDKMKAPHPPGGAHHRGYSAPGSEKVSQHVYDEEEIAKISEDYKESFESGNPLDPYQPNIWPPPTLLPGFQPFLETFFTHCAALIHHILDAISTALAVPAPGLSPTHSTSPFQLRLLHYPSLPSSHLSHSKRSRINAHSDFGSLTLLFQDAVGGLEIQNPHQGHDAAAAAAGSGGFRPAPPIAGTVLVNIGDLMARWSNDRYRSTVHRVGLPEGWGVAGDMVPDRYSIPFFAMPDVETVIEALPGCWDDRDAAEGGRPKKYDPVTAMEYVQMRMAALYQS
ncbi:thymine dioxygenase [Byssothecium circinans]|uniref:Thymine dioxygenase n=1 Tax=Byssothecium circinans TaxID=147558 RepID=A0A6A5TC66_9PLEO|nr:thymine dioxygenase [Byssothecium circinans]